MRKAVLKLDGTPVLAHAVEATWPWERMRGLLGRKNLDTEFAMVFKHCPRIHCKGMSITIDVVSLAKDGTVLDARAVRPGEMGPKLAHCHTVVEMAEGRAAEVGIKPGCVLEIS